MNTVAIPLTRGKWAFIDAADLPLVAPYAWRVNEDTNTTYAVGWVGSRSVKMHRLLLDAPQGVGVDHINGDGLDNRRVNLRLATPFQNSGNRHGLVANNTSGVTGVVLRGDRYLVLVGTGIDRYIGTFDSLEDAAQARQQAECARWGEHAPGVIEIEPIDLLDVLFLPKPPRKVRSDASVYGLGVYLTSAGKYAAILHHKYLGVYDTPAAAAEARAEAKRRLLLRIDP